MSAGILKRSVGPRENMLSHAFPTPSPNESSQDVLWSRGAEALLVTN